VKYYFKMISSIPVLFVEVPVRLKISSVKEHLGAIAKVILECDGQGTFNAKF